MVRLWLTAGRLGNTGVVQCRCRKGSRLHGPCMVAPPLPAPPLPRAPALFPTQGAAQRSCPSRWGTAGPGVGVLLQLGRNPAAPACAPSAFDLSGRLCSLQAPPLPSHPSLHLCGLSCPPARPSAHPRRRAARPRAEGSGAGAAAAHRRCRHHTRWTSGRRLWRPPCLMWCSRCCTLWAAPRSCHMPARSWRFRAGSSCASCCARCRPRETSRRSRWAQSWQLRRSVPGSCEGERDRDRVPCSRQPRALLLPAACQVQ